MRRGVLFLLLLLLFPTPGQAQAGAILSTLPDRADVYEGDRKVGATPWEVNLDRGTTHHVVLRHDGFNDMQVDLKGAGSGWQITVTSGEDEDTRINDRFLPYSVAFSKAIRIKPDGARAWVQVPKGDRPPGIDVDVKPLQEKDETFILPMAHKPMPMYVTRDGYEAWQKKFSEGELDATPNPFVLEASLKPTMGTIARSIGLGAAGVSLVGFTVWAVVWLPRQRKAKHQLAIASTIAEKTADLVPGDQLPPLLGVHVTTEELKEEFVIINMLGKGGYGAVFEAAPAGPNRPVDEHWAVKVLFKGAWEDPTFQERFMREVGSCRDIQHNGIVKVLDWGTYRRPGGEEKEVVPFMVMELLTGRDMRSVLTEAGAERLPLPRVLQWTWETLSALRAAHAKNVIHRDLKPENIWITTSDHVKLMDFGMARQVDKKSLTQSGSAMGTPAYMSPEHVNAKRVTPASDIYSVGVTLFEMLSGTLPFDDEEGDMYAMVMKMLSEDPKNIRDLRPDIPEPLAAMVMKMIERDRDARYQTADACMAELRALSESLQSSRS